MPSVVVIGAGIAGLSTASVLADHTDVLVVEMEATPAHHATGRSAALYIPTYGPPTIRRLTRASLEWLASRGGGVADADLISPRLVMFAADAAHIDHLHATADGMGDAGGTLHLLTASETRDICPALRPDWVEAGGVDRDAYDMDVAAIVATFRRVLAQRGGTIDLGRRVTGLSRIGSGWEVRTTGGPVSCDVVVNAAGAWVDDVAALAGIEPLGFVPKRRTIGIGRVGEETAGLVGRAFVAHAAEQWYFGAEPGGVLFSPADETPSDPCDARPEEIDLARALDGIDAATSLGMRSVSSSWAGLRTFSPDGSIVIGEDPLARGFVWCGGQGGYGIHTSEAAARATAAVALGEPLPADLVAHGLEAADLVPDRLR
ncbi:MAG: FAD-binding oxidoreductase [Actinomycetota bacterium]